MARTVWCSNCLRRQPTEQNDIGLICCTGCGKVVDQDIYSNEPTFVKNAAGQSQMSGNYVKTVQSDYSASRERTLNNAYDFIMHLADNLGIQGGDQISQPALAFYTIALERNFTRGRRADQVATACLYITCREQNRPYLLIEFAEFLGVNLCKLLSLEEHPIVQKPVDPSLFIHRFTHVLLGGKNHEVETSALRIMTSMKKNWLQTGRKPSGLCGAALYISALAHGLKFTKADIVKIVHICEATLTKRLIEFEDTSSGSLTIEELNQNAEDLEKNLKSSRNASSSDLPGKFELLCEHKGSGKPHFAHGLCEICHEEFVKISGGLGEGAEPPAFQRAERERMAMKHAHENATNSLGASRQMQINCIATEVNKEMSYVDSNTSERLDSVDSGGVRTKVASTNTDHYQGGDDNTITVNGDDSGNFSDIDDVEVDGYLHNEEEKEYKKVIWEEMNREYLEAFRLDALSNRQEQAAKEAAAAAAREAEMVSFQNCSADVLAARELAAAVAAKVAKSKKEQRQKRAAEMRTPQTAAEATHQILTRKKLSSRVNYDVLREIFDEPYTAKTMMTAPGFELMIMTMKSKYTANTMMPAPEYKKCQKEDLGLEKSVRLTRSFRNILPEFWIELRNNGETAIAWPESWRYAIKGLNYDHQSNNYDDRTYARLCGHHHWPTTWQRRRAERINFESFLLQWRVEMHSLFDNSCLQPLIEAAEDSKGKYSIGI
ncbi:hypothetical protein V2J09_013395 [Rumex salicifolius]